MRPGQTKVQTADTLDRRCRVCTALSLGLGLLPLTLICWLALNIPAPGLLSRVTEQAERDAKARLADAGLASLALKVKDGVGLVVGHPPTGATAASAFEKAEDALAPMTGVAGIVDRLENHVASDSAAAMKD